MLVYVGTNAVITYDLEFKQMVRWEGEDNLNGFIRFDNSHYLKNISDPNLIGDGYVNLSDGIIYWRKSKYQQYYSYIDNNVFIKDYNGNESFAKITYYDDDALVANLYRFYADNDGMKDEDGDLPSTPTTSVTDPSLYSIIHTELRCREKEQVRPTDKSQEWVDTEEVRDKEECDVQYDSCECGIEYQWVSVGTICDGVNKCDKLKYQYKDTCNGSWKDYSPLIYKIGDVIEYDSSECGTYEYKEEWDENTYCGSYLNELYKNNLVSTSKYKVKYPYIKKIDGHTWEKLDCEKLIGTELVKSNSFECGYKTTRTTYTYDNDLCGSAVKQRYPSLSGATDTNRYKVTITHKEETAPYPTNTDDMEQSEWVWVETGTSYSYSVTTSNDCGCDWVGTKYVTGNTVYCGKDLKNTIIGDDILTVTSYEGDWYKNPDYDLYTSNRIGKNEKTKIRIKFNMATSGSVVINFNISSESSDRLYIGKIDGDISLNYSTYYGGSSSLNGSTNYYTFSNVSSGNHWIELEYRKDSSVDSGRDNVTVYLSSKYASFNKYQIAEEYEYCGNTLFNKTGNYKLVNQSINNISTMFNCDWSSISYFVSDEKECGYRLGDGYTPTTEYTKIKAYEYSNLTSGFTSGDTESLLPYAIDDFYYWSATTTNSYTCGYQGSKDFDTGEDSCCGSLGEELQILKVEGLGEGSWHQEGEFYFPYPLTATGETAQLKIHFKSNSGIRVHINATSSNGMNYMVSQLDSETSYSLTQSTATTINRTVEDEDDHFIIVKIKYTNQYYLNYIPMVRFSVYADCEPFYEYNIYETKYTTDGKNYQSYNPPKYKYYSKTSNSPKEECGYRTYIEQWVELCPDITYADVDADRSLLGNCANCYEYNGINALFSNEIRQVSYDLGLTWINDYSTNFRKGRLLRKSDTELGDLC